MTYSVIIIRDEDQLIPAKYINRFFKLCGIYTYDYAMPQHAGNSGFPDCFGFDCIILMTHQNNAKATLKTYSNQSIVEFPVPTDANLSDTNRPDITSLHSFWGSVPTVSEAIRPS